MNTPKRIDEILSKQDKGYKKKPKTKDKGKGNVDEQVAMIVATTSLN